MTDRALAQSAMAGDPTATDTALDLLRPAVLTYCRVKHLLGHSACHSETS
ncbi:hypothetical protein [Amycolatopsis sp. NPDC051061]